MPTDEEPVPISELSDGRLKNLFFSGLRKRKEEGMPPSNLTELRTELYRRGLMDEEGNINHTKNQKKAHKIQVWVGREKILLRCPHCGCDELVEKRDGTLRCPACEYTKLREIFVKYNADSLRSNAVQNTG